MPGPTCIALARSIPLVLSVSTRTVGKPAAATAFRRSAAKFDPRQESPTVGMSSAVSAGSYRPLRRASIIWPTIRWKG